MKKACLIDVSRFRVPTMERMREMLKRLADTGYNQIFFNIEHVFKIEKHPWIGAEADGFTDKEFKEIDDYAHGIGLELIPVFQSIGHVFHILKLKQYEYLEETNIKWSLAIANEDSYKLLEDYYEVLAQTFRSKYIHVGGDEVYDLLDGQSKEMLADGRTKDEHYIDHMLKMKKMLAKYNKEIMIWGDMIEKNPDVVKKLGDDIIICYWNYDFKELPEAYTKIKNKIYVCPGIQTWKSFFLRVDYAVRNMKLMHEYMKKINAYGFMITDWGDGGHVHPLTFSEKMFELGYKIFTGEDVDNISGESDFVKEVVTALDKIHFADYLNSECTLEQPAFVTRQLFHTYIFRGKCFADQTDAQLEEILTRIDALKKVLDGNKGFKPATEFEKELFIFVEKTFLFEERVRIHLDFRKNADGALIAEKIDRFIINLRKWFSTFIINWHETSQPMGIYFYFHYIKQVEIDMLSELKFLNTLDKNYKYDDVTKKESIWESDEHGNLFSVAHFNSLKYLWDEFRL